MSDGPPKRTIIVASSAPKLPRHIKMRHDVARDRWILLGPERIFTPDAVAVAVLNLCDGLRTVDQIAGELAQAYSAPKATILADVISMLQGLADKGVVAA